MQTATLLSLLLAAAAQPETGINALKQNPTYQALTGGTHQISNLEDEIMWSRSALKREVIYSCYETNPGNPPLRIDTHYCVSPDYKLALIDIYRKRGNRRVKSGQRKIVMQPAQDLHISPSLQIVNGVINFQHQERLCNYMEVQPGSVYALDDARCIFSSIINNSDDARFYMMAAPESCTTLSQAIGFIKTVLQSKKTPLTHRAFLPLINAQSESTQQKIIFSLQSKPTMFTFTDYGITGSMWGKFTGDIQSHVQDNLFIKPTERSLCAIVSEGDINFVALCAPETYSIGAKTSDPNLHFVNGAMRIETHIQ